MRRTALILATILLATAPASAQIAVPATMPAPTPATVPAMGPATAPVRLDAFDLLDRLYRPLCPPGELAWPMKVHAILSAGSGAGGELKFSTSTRELFFTWARSNCADWLRDTTPMGGAWVQCHGDVHFGNVGSYAADLATGRMALGLVDFDESAAMPFQTDLLQAMVTLRLQAAADGLAVDDVLARRAARALLSGYREAADTGRTATDLLSSDPRVADLLAIDTRKTPRDAADAWLENGAFRRTVTTKKGKLREVFRPALRETEDGAPYTKRDLAEAIMRAVGTSPKLERLATHKNSAAWEANLEGAVLRTRLGSGGSQGLVKMLVYVRAAVKLPGGTSDAVVYLKEQSSSAAQRAGYVPADVTGGRRAFGGGSVLTSPEVDAQSWTELAGGAAGVRRSFLVDVRNPWDTEIDVKLADAGELEWAARYLGTVLGAAHTHAAGGVEGARRLRTRANEALERQLVDRSAEFVKVNRAAHQAMRNDPRARELEARAQAALDLAGK